MCYNELGVTCHLIQPSNRFHENGKEEFIDENGNKGILEEVTNFNNPLFEDKGNGLPALRDHNWHKKIGYKHVKSGLWTPEDANAK